MDVGIKLSKNTASIYLETINSLFDYRDDPEYSDAAIFLTLCITGEINV